jgi:lysophospholipase L1-like esterase
MYPCWKKAVLALTLFAVSGFTLVMAGTEKSVPLKKGETIVFLGDSITAGGVKPKGYVTLIEGKLQEKRPNLEITIIGAGVSGNKVPDLQRRLEKSVLAKKPSLVVIYIGINDVWHGEANPAAGTSKDQFEGGLKEIIGKSRRQAHA